MQTASTNRLFVSFWAICLDNLPAGVFRHRLISADDAKRRIDQARQQNALLCLSDADLLAPYRKQERDNHEALCRSLMQDWGIDLSLKDFCSNSGDEAAPLYTANPIGCMQVRGQNRLLIVTCHYAWVENPIKAPPTFQIAPGSIGFHLIETNQANEMPSVSVATSSDPLFGSMREDAELLDQIVADAMRQRQIQAWHPGQDDFAALEAIADATGQTVQDVLNDAVRHFLDQRDLQTKK